MQILKSSKERLPEQSQYVDTRPDIQTTSLDKKVAMQKACSQAVETLNLNEWIDSDGSIFSSYSDLLDYQTDKFTRRYPPHFAVALRPELTLIIEQQRVWSWEAVRLLMTDFNQFYKFRCELDRYILKENHFDYDKFIHSPDLKDREKEALNVLLDKFYLDYLEK